MRDTRSSTGPPDQGRSSILGAAGVPASYRGQRLLLPDQEATSPLNTAAKDNTATITGTVDLTAVDDRQLVAIS